MTFDRVVALIREEREHQTKKWGSVQDHPHEVAGWLVLMEEYVAKARYAWATSSGDAPALADIRKATALGFACLEQHGCSWRGLPVSANNVREADADFVQKARELAESSEENYRRGIEHFLSMGHKEVSRLHADLQRSHPDEIRRRLVP